VALVGALRPEAKAASARATTAFSVPGGTIPAGLETVVFGGGCFWGVQAVFQHVEGVEAATSGYAGGSAETATYKITSTGRTGHAEAVRVVFDPARVSFGQLLEVFFTVAHDPTQLNRQGPDVGPQYRSTVWTTSDAQAGEVRAYIDRLDETGQYSREAVTEVAPLDEFYLAEDYHQDYLINHPYSPYIRIHDMPKLKHLERDFPNLWRDGTAPWKAAAAD
jgi:peptide-methionine (S)-S-oxide reductase